MPRKRCSTDGMARVLPSDLLIFSPAAVIHALCIQYDANACPAARDWACSFSWWGKRRSTPPPWMSKAVPRYFDAIAEHSMCQPGRPRPQGLGHDAVSGSDSLRPFQRAKSRGSRLPRGIGVLCRLHVVDLLVGQLAVRRPGPHVEVDVAGAVGGGVGVTALDQRLDQLDHLGDVAGGRRLVGRRGDVERGVGVVQLALHRGGEVVPGPALCCGLGQDLVVDVGDVADEGDLETEVAQPALQDVEGDARAHVPDVRLRLHGQAAQVETGLPLLEGDEVADFARRGVVEPEGHPASLGMSRAGAPHREINPRSDPVATVHVELLTRR